RGVMKGLSSGRVQFAGLFDLYALPGSVLPEEPDEAAEAAFQTLYRNARDLCGVKNVDETRARMAELGVDVPQSRFNKLLEDSRNSLLFSLG
ncbi:MAG: hypothetical protein AAFZ09_19225, partial [Pseudomonadota bacterium]